MNKKKLGKNLKEIREIKGISKYKLVKNSSLVYSQIDSIENGDTNYTVDVLMIYMEEVGVDISIISNE